VSAYIGEPDAYRRAAADSAAAVKTRSLVEARIRAMHATQEIFRLYPQASNVTASNLRVGAQNLLMDPKINLGDVARYG
jgi:hypothetical protein